jgi:hypothetical protein
LTEIASKISKVSVCSGRILIISNGEFLGEVKK